jgi:peptidoglycan-associated lipoprotein
MLAVILKELPVRKSALMMLILSVALVAGGCAAKRAKPDTSQASSTPAVDASAATAAAATSGAGTPGEVVRVTPPANDGFSAGPSGELLSKRLVYFDFDRDELRAGDQAVVAAHAKYLVSNPSIKVRLEGHTDERGTREYNIGLGERRAQAVRRALMLQGVGEQQLTTVSFGEERPAVPGEDEAAWSQNRRVEILYVN